MKKLIFYTKPECPLCDDIREILNESDFNWDEVNILENPECVQRYGHEIPVLKKEERFWFYRDRDRIPLKEWLSEKEQGG